VLGAHVSSALADSDAASALRPPKMALPESVQTRCRPLVKQTVEKRVLLSARWPVGRVSTGQVTAAMKVEATAVGCSQRSPLTLTSVEAPAAVAKPARLLLDKQAPQQLRRLRGSRLTKAGGHFSSSSCFGSHLDPLAAGYSCSESFCSDFSH
jgi:hypothetical protein